MPFKYQNEIDGVCAMGLVCPPENLTAPNNYKAYRFVFEDKGHVKNHKPVGNPKRLLQTSDEKKCRLYSLSCFSDQDGAITFFWNMKQIHKQFEKTVGNMLWVGLLVEDDGLVTEPEADNHTHFELFEFVGCNLSNKKEEVFPLM